MKKVIYDNSNLAESYSGATSPLTYSFARYVYQEVYKHFCAMMGVSNSDVEKNKAIFPNMIEHIGYHMYYNLGNWYTLISLLPGYRFNKPFFEKMLGVEKEDDTNTDQAVTGAVYRYFVFLPKLIFQAWTILLSFIFMGYHVRSFNSYFDKTFKKLKDVPLEKLDLIELQDLYNRLCTSLIRKWRVPIANDLAVMISTGIAGKLYSAWIRDGEMYTYLRLGAHQNLISLDPGLELKSITDVINVNPPIRGLFLSSIEPQKVLEKLGEEFAKDEATIRIFAYLETFGSRSPNELKLEAESLAERPETIIKLLRMKINSDGLHTGNNVGHVDIPHIPKEAGMLRGLILGQVFRWARNSIRRREETRFRRALIFGYSRKIFLAVGSLLAKDSVLEKQRDVFYLNTEEIFSGEGEKKGALKVIVKQRAGEYEKWKAVDMPRRIETEDSINDIERGLLQQTKSSIKVNTKIFCGLVASKTEDKNVEGEALVLREFDPDVLFDGKILITRQTDPGWTIVFPLLKAIVVERGGMLSHAAIVARELGIPCIVGVAKSTEHFSTGAKIVLDMETGEVMLR